MKGSPLSFQAQVLGLLLACFAVGGLVGCGGDSEGGGSKRKGIH